MDILFLLIPLAILLVAVAAGAFLWSVKSGQFDDLEGPAHRILMDDDDARIPGPKTTQQSAQQLKQEPK